VLLRAAGRLGPDDEEDENVIRIRDLLRLLGSGDADGKALPDALIPYRRAFELDEGPDEPVRAVLEAHVLARRPLVDVARAMGVSTAIVQAYEATFFNVVDRLDSVGYIGTYVLQTKRPSKPTLGFLLRSSAYASGPVVLDDLLWYFGLGQFAPSPVSRPPDPVAHDLWRRAAIASMLLPVEPRSVRALAELELRYQRLEQLIADPERYREALLRTRRGQIQRLRRAFGAAAIRKCEFLATMLPLDPLPK
jgi:hypothetical protein